MKIFNLVILIFLFSSILFAQEMNTTSHPFSGAWVLTGEGGVTIGATDFPDMKPSYFGKGSFEYFFPTSSSSVFGLRLFGGGGYIAGKGFSSNQPLYANIDEFKTKIVFGGFGLIYSLSLGKVVQPYLSAGVSYLIFDPLDKNGNKMPRYSAGEYMTDEKDFMGEFGIRFLLSEKFSFNLSYTFNYLQNDNLDDIFSSKDDAFHFISGGLSYYFLSSSDSDGDGVKDSKDLCENTPIGVIVDEFGCPIDSDSDKIPDYLDLCQHTPIGVTVDSNGCPLDSDNDGVPDYLDECADTEENIIVDENGCEKLIEQKESPIEEKINTEDERLILILSGTANFEFGKSELLPNPKSGLDKLVEFMKKYSETNWIIEGHTDNRGKEEFNKKLSLERAKAVESYFLQKGINKNRFEIIGSGSTRPVADNTIEFGRALNRRVVIEEKNSFVDRNKLMSTVKFIEYDFSNEFNIESLIFTDGEYYCIQVSSWKTREKANEEVERLIADGHSAFFILSNVKDNNEKWFRVRIGYFDNLEGTREYQKYIR